jgi:septal ring factor EnvC (AmiA/AmiB activator)
VIEHPRRDGWQLADGVTPAETTESVYRFRVTVQPRATATLHVDEVRPIETTVSASNIKHEHIRLLLQARTLNPTLAPQVEQLGAQAQEVARLQAEVAARREEVKRIGEDQARVRENLKALKGSDAERALVERYTRQLGAQEDRLELLRTEIERLQAEATAAQQAFTKSLTGLTLDVRM